MYGIYNPWWHSGNAYSHASIHSSLAYYGNVVFYTLLINYVIFNRTIGKDEVNRFFHCVCWRRWIFKRRSVVFIAMPILRRFGLLYSFHVTFTMGNFPFKWQQHVTLSLSFSRAICVKLFNERFSILFSFTFHATQQCRRFSIFFRFAIQSQTKSSP